MADRDQQSTDEGVETEGGAREQMEKHLSPKPAREQDMPAEVRPPTPLEEAGEQKDSNEGLADRDIGPDRGA